MNETTLLVAAVSAVSGLLGAAVAAYLKISGDRHEKAKELRAETAKEWADLANRQDRELEASVARIAKLELQREVLTARASECFQNFSRAEERIVRLEDMLTERGVAFRKWTPRDTGDSTTDIPTIP